MKILVTGGTGYIGSHAAVELLDAGHDVVVADNLSNSSQKAIQRIQELTGKQVEFYKVDLCDKSKLNEVFTAHTFDAVMHFAGLKAVGESVEKPLAYYRNNIDSTLTLLEVMRQHDVSKIVFSSSATVYGTPQELPLTESSPTGVGITNPYGQTKFMIEQILRDVAKADNNIQVILLRYFNPIGAHDSGLIGEDPNGLPNNLFPFILQVAAGKLKELSIFGNDYDTPDGTGIRDYIHVVDLAKGHVSALQNMQPGVKTYNLGTGKGTSVLELVQAFEQTTGQKVPRSFTDRRPGDIDVMYADVSKANKDLYWEAEKTIDDACTDSWRWQTQNPDGFKS